MCSATIDKLRKDNESLKEELFLENKFSVTPTDNIAAHRISCLQDEADALTRKVRPAPHPLCVCARSATSVCQHAYAITCAAGPELRR